MRYKMWTGPCGARQVADAIAMLHPDITDVLAGTEYVHFDSPHSSIGIERIARDHEPSRQCWPFLPAMRSLSCGYVKDEGCACTRCSTARTVIDLCLSCQSVHPFSSRCRGAL